MSSKSTKGIDLIELAQSEEKDHKARQLIRNENKVLYQSSESHLGFLERISETGAVTVGQFLGGKFVAKK